MTNGSQAPGRPPSSDAVLSRRGFLGAVAVAGVAVAGCGGSGGSGGADDKTLSLQTWANNDAEKRAFRQLAAGFEKANKGVTVELLIVPFAQMYETLDSKLAAGKAPDLTRIQYQQVGRYSSKNALLDLSDHLDKGLAKEFGKPFWNAVTYEGRVYGMPHTTNGTAIYYNKDLFDEIGVEPADADGDGWTWDEFSTTARKIIDSGKVKYPFAMNWTGPPNAYRWMQFLFQNGGRLLDDELKQPAIDSPEALEALTFTSQWFAKKVVPAGTSIKTSEQPEQLFAEGTVAMVGSGAYMLPFMTGMKAEFGVMPMIHNEQQATDFGGNAIAATRSAKNADLAAEFLQYLGSEEAMKKFCVTANFAPTRPALAAQQLEYELLPELQQQFDKAIANVDPTMATQQAIPTFNAMNQVLADELEATFRAGQAPAESIDKIAEGLKKTLDRA